MRPFLSIALLAAFSSLASAADPQDPRQIIILPCFAITPPLNAPGAGGKGVFDITQSTVCGKGTLTVADPWVTMTAVASQNSSIVRWTMEPNPGSAPRSTQAHYVTPGAPPGFPGSDDYFTVTQAGSCASTFDNPLPVVPASGGSGQVGLTLQTPGCAWSAASPVWWVSVAPASGNQSTQLNWSVNPNFSSRQRTTSLTAGTQTLQVTQLANTAAQDERMVQLIYYGLLGRLPAETELRSQVNALRSGMSSIQLFLNIVGSAEFDLGGHFVGDLYLRLLERAPDYEGWLGHRRALLSGLASPQALAAGFLSSPEYAVKVGNPSAVEFVRRLYQNIFKREISPAESSFQVAGLGADQPADRANLVIRLLSSAEYRTIPENNLTAPRFYVSNYLKLAPFAHAAGLLQRGTSVLELRDIEFDIEVSIPQAIANIMTSPAFVASIQ